jgi:hypothetical protein
LIFDSSILLLICVAGYTFYLKRAPVNEIGLVDNEQPASQNNTNKNLPDVASSQEEVNPGSG